SSRRRHTRWPRDWSSDVCSSDLSMQPDHALSRFHRDLARLLTGDYARGWADYEARLESREYARPRQYPRWTGSSLSGKSILIYEIGRASCRERVESAEVET